MYIWLVNNYQKLSSALRQHIFRPMEARSVVFSLPYQET